LHYFFCSISSISAEVLNNNKPQDVKVFAINLEHSVDRKEHILDECKRHNLEPILFKAVDGSKLSEEQLSEMVLDHKINGITKKEIGCALSHIGVYKRIVDENINLALILEDDAVLNDNISSVLHEISIFNESTDKPFVYLLNEPNSYIKNKEIKLSSITLYRVFDARGAHGYVINYKAAKSLSNYLLPVRLVADEWKYFQYGTNIKIYAVVPPVAFINNTEYPSTITDRSKRMGKIAKRYEHKLFYPDIKTFLRRHLWKGFIKPFLKIEDFEELNQETK
jgi:glycosyl transferase family 25